MNYTKIASKAKAQLSNFMGQIPEFAAYSIAEGIKRAFTRFGKVDELTLRPLSFAEFLTGTGDAPLAQLLESGDEAAIDTMRETFIERLRRYFFTGGMPEALAAFAQGRPLADVRRIQNNIILAYQNDFSKHAPTREVPRLNLVWRSLVAQLAKENKKFIYIDFLVQRGTEVIPVEVKAAENLNSKSLRTFVATHENLKGVRFSLAPHRDQGWMRNVPLYAVGTFFRT